MHTTTRIYCRSYATARKKARGLPVARVDAQTFIVFRTARERDIWRQLNQRTRQR
jgi:hypothetical protein